MFDTIQKGLAMYNSSDVSKIKTERPSRAALFQKYAADYLMTMRSVYYNGCLYTYRDKCYRPEQEPEVMLLRWFQMKEIPLTSSDITNILAHVKAFSLMDAHKFPAIPFFIKGWADDPINFIPFQNGLLNLEKHCQGETELTPHTPNFVSLYALPFDFDPEAQCPKWLDFLGQVFEGDEARIRLLQEWFGYCLTPDVSLQKFMVLLGLPRSGKGTTSSILAQLLGPENTTAFDLYRLLDRFSTSALRTKQLAVVGEVELSGAKEKARILEKLKSITGNDLQVVERKGVDVKESCVLPTRWMISCNQMPVLHDTSGALEARMLVLRLHLPLPARRTPAFSTSCSPSCLASLCGPLRGCGGFVTQVGPHRLPRSKKKRTSVVTLRRPSPFCRTAAKCIALGSPPSPLTLRGSLRSATSPVSNWPKHSGAGLWIRETRTVEASNGFAGMSAPSSHSSDKWRQRRRLRASG